MRISNENASGRTAITACCNRCAFTLIEIICVVVILAIAALIAIPVFSGASQMQVKAAADKLAADIEYAKSLAVTTQKNHGVIFSTSTGSYSLYDMSVNPAQIINDPVKKAPFTVTYSSRGSRLEAVTISAVNFNGTSSVEFDYTGCPHPGGAPAIALTTGTVTLTAKGMNFVVHVEPVTGYVSIQ